MLGKRAIQFRHDPGETEEDGSFREPLMEPLETWRVVHADGSLAKGERQRALLDREGVPFRGARVDMPVARRYARVKFEASEKP